MLPSSAGSLVHSQWARFSVCLLSALCSTLPSAALTVCCSGGPMNPAACNATGGQAVGRHMRCLICLTGGQEVGRHMRSSSGQTTQAGAHVSVGISPCAEMYRLLCHGPCAATSRLRRPALVPDQWSDRDSTSASSASTCHKRWRLACAISAGA
jgi:hypothetical protein